MSDRLLVLVRHGQSDWNLKNLFTGWRDPDLTELGVEEAKTGGKALEISVQPLLSLTGDEKAIRQLTSILLDNALKYSPEGGSVSLRLEKEQRAIRLSVSNTTEQGFDPGSTAKLFERFYRGDESHSSQSGGYGIGLSIAKAVVNAHRGRISASAQDGRTLTVTALFPT